MSWKFLRVIMPAVFHPLYIVKVKRTYLVGDIRDQVFKSLLFYMYDSRVTRWAASRRFTIDVVDSAIECGY